MIKTRNKFWTLLFISLAAATVLNDHPINRMMRKIDAMCHKFIALHLPSAGHLRLLSSVIRANIELERIGDYAVTICREALQLSAPPHGHLATELERVGSETQSMLQSAIEAFNELNAEKARTTMMLEEHMENNLDIVYAELAANDEQDAVKNVLAIFAVFTQLKRVVDQAKNLCEEAVFATSRGTVWNTLERIDIPFHETGNTTRSCLNNGLVHYSILSIIL